MEKELEGFLDDLASRVLTYSQENLVIDGTIDTGFLLRSARIESEPLTRRIVYDCPYSESIEYGSRPHHVSGATLEGWVERKLGISGKQGRSVAWAIARKITKEGTLPRPFLRPAVDRARRELDV